MRLTSLKPRVQTLGASANKGWATPSRGTPAQRGYGTEWRHIRQRILERDGYCCQTCARMDIVRAGNIVDHIVNKLSGGSDEHSNLEVICAEHHKIKTAQESLRSRRGC